MIGTLFVTAALAFDPMTAAQETLRTTPEASGAVACSRYDAAAPVLAVLGRTLARTGALPRVFDPPGDAAARGIDPQAPVVVALNGALVVKVELGFTGTPEQAQALARSIDTPAAGPDERTALSQAITADLSDHTLTLTGAVGSQKAGLREFLPSRAVPGTEGCALVLDAVTASPVRANGFVPYLGGGDAVFFMESPAVAEAQMRTDAELVQARLPVPPSMITTMSARLQDTLETTVARPPMPKDLALVLDAAAPHVQFPAGLVTASWGRPQEDAGRAAVTRITDARGRPFPAAKLTKLLIEWLADHQAAQVDKDTLSFVNAKQELVYVAVGRGGELLVTSSLPLTDTAFGDAGVPWLTPEDEARARAATSVVRLEDPVKKARLWITIRPVAGGNEGVAHVDLTVEQRVAILGLAVLAGPALPAMFGLTGDAEGFLPGGKKPAPAPE